MHKESYGVVLIRGEIGGFIFECCIVKTWTKVLITE